MPKINKKIQNKKDKKNIKKFQKSKIELVVKKNNIFKISIY